MSRIFGETRQIGYVVDDIESAMAFFSEKAGVGPWFYAELISLREFRYRGVPQTIEISAALANSGSLQFELIQQRNDAPSAYRDWRARHPAGNLVQHHSSWTERYDAVFAAAVAKGFEPIHEGRSAHGRFAYFTHPDDPDFMCEVTEYTPGRRYMFAEVARAAIDWDGRDPVRKGWPDPAKRKGQQAG